jgi:diaminopimelate decarboxylase
MAADRERTRAALADAAREFGTPAFVYFLDHIRARIAAVRAAFGGRFTLRYAMKSNPNAALLARLRDLVDGLDVSSGGEVTRGIAAGWPAARIGFTGPGKTRRELVTAMAAGIGEIVVESVEEAEALNALAAEHGRRQAILARIAPARMPRGFGVHMSGKPTQFGIDEEDADAALARLRTFPHLDLCGLHIYAGTQSLDADAIVQNLENFVALFARLSDAHDLRPRALVFGSGFGIPYYEQDTPLDLSRIAAAINPALDALKASPRFAATDVVLETGRYLVGEAGFFLAGVTRVKHSRGSDIAILDGGMNHHLGAAGHLGSIVQRNYRMFRVSGSGAGAHAYTLVGPLCTSIDTLGRQVTLPALAAGDVLAIECSGAYGLTASPIHFIGHEPAKEILVESRGDAAVARDVSEISSLAAGAAR